jgi:hypothetical protein
VALNAGAFCSLLASPENKKFIWPNVLALVALLAVVLVPGRNSTHGTTTCCPEVPRTDGEVEGVDVVGGVVVVVS